MWWNGKPARCYVRPDVSDQHLGQLFRVLAIDADADVLEYPDPTHAAPRRQGRLRLTLVR